jgi:DUF917 family protein
MPNYALSTAEEVEDFVRGLTLLGTGGGGRPDSGRDFLMGHVKAGKAVGWADLGVIPDDAWVCSAFYMGSVAPRGTTFDPRRRWPEFGETRVEQPLVSAVEELEAYVGVEISALVAFELGAANTAGPMDAAARLGLLMMDGDAAGRAVPELVQAYPFICGKEFCPASICDQWGNVLLMKKTTSGHVAEMLGKMVSTVTKKPDPHSYCGFAGFLSRAGEIKKTIIPGTLTQSLEIGLAVREARVRGEEPVAAAVQALKGWLLFQGEVVGKDWEDKDGYLCGTTTIQGVNSYQGRMFKVWIKNENHISWLNGSPFVCSPDLIMIVELGTAEPIVNTNLKLGQQVAVLGKANRLYRSRDALQALGPCHFGFDIDYVPIEELIA